MCLFNFPLSYILKANIVLSHHCVYVTALDALQMKCCIRVKLVQKFIFIGSQIDDKLKNNTDSNNQKNVINGYWQYDTHLTYSIHNK